MKKISTPIFSLLFLLFASISPLLAQNRSTHYFQGSSEMYHNPSSNELFAFPNPATNYVTVQLPYMASYVVDILVLDYNGTVLRNYRFAPGGQSYSIDISFLEKGNYILHVQEGGKLTGIVKLLKNR